jgi:hypothetical protein
VTSTRSNGIPFSAVFRFGESDRREEFVQEDFTGADSV